MRITIRMDDITPDMNWERFYRCKALLDQYQVKPLIGVVPDNQDDMLCFEGQKNKPEDFWAYIRSLQEEGWVIAMHGCTHIYSKKTGGMFPLNDFSEFAGHSLKEQKEKLEKGKKLLTERGIETDIFMAPAHAYDGNTLTALRETGFNKITDGFGNNPYLWKGIHFYPISFKLSKSLKKKTGFTTMVIHSNTVTDDELERYHNYFKDAGSTRWISYQEFLKVPPARRTIVGRAYEYLLAKLKFLLVKFL